MSSKAKKMQILGEIGGNEKVSQDQEQQTMVLILGVWKWPHLLTTQYSITNNFQVKTMSRCLQVVPLTNPTQNHSSLFAWVVYWLTSADFRTCLASAFYKYWNNAVMPRCWQISSLSCLHVAGWITLQHDSTNQSQNPPPKPLSICLIL